MKSFSASQQWNAVGVSKMLSVPWQPEGDGVDSTAFVMPPDLGLLQGCHASKRKKRRMNSLKTWRQDRVRV